MVTSPVTVRGREMPQMLLTTKGSCGKTEGYLYACRNPRALKGGKDCPERKNQSHKNQIGASRVECSTTKNHDLRTGLSPIEGSRRRHSEDCLQNSLWPLRISSYAVWFDKRTCRIHGPYESEQERARRASEDNIGVVEEKWRLYAKFSKCEFWI
ncbi:hypothetical protein Tco_1428803 [Tanacetum coccineum]